MNTKERLEDNFYWQVDIILLSLCLFLKGDIKASGFKQNRISHELVPKRKKEANKLLDTYICASQMMTIFLPIYPSRDEVVWLFTLLTGCWLHTMDCKRRFSQVSFPFYITTSS